MVLGVPICHRSAEISDVQKLSLFSEDEHHEIMNRALSGVKYIERDTSTKY